MIYETVKQLQSWMGQDYNMGSTIKDKMISDVAL